MIKKEEQETTVIEDNCVILLALLVLLFPCTAVILRTKDEKQELPPSLGLLGGT